MLESDEAHFPGHRHGVTGYQHEIIIHDGFHEAAAERAFAAVLATHQEDAFIFIGIHQQSSAVNDVEVTAVVRGEETDQLPDNVAAGLAAVMGNASLVIIHECPAALAVVQGDIQTRILTPGKIVIRT
jgi:hypothetical protein